MRRPTLAHREKKCNDNDQSCYPLNLDLRRDEISGTSTFWEDSTNYVQGSGDMEFRSLGVKFGYMM